MCIITCAAVHPTQAAVDPTQCGDASFYSCISAACVVMQLCITTHTDVLTQSPYSCTVTSVNSGSIRSMTSGRVFRFVDNMHEFQLEDRWHLLMKDTLIHFPSLWEAMLYNRVDSSELTICVRLGYLGICRCRVMLRSVLIGAALF